MNETDGDNLPDRGKFPAARRRRLPKDQKSDANTSRQPTGQSTTSPRANQERRKPGPKPKVPEHVHEPMRLPQPPPEPSLAETPSNGVNIVNNPTEPAEDMAISKPPQTSGTIWPDNKQTVLAQVASDYLKSNPANRDKENSQQFMLGMISKNPSYSELCQLLEDQGLVINRVQFAKHLLGAVPDLSRPTTSPKPSQPPSVSPSAKQSKTNIPAQSQIQVHFTPSTGHTIAPSSSGNPSIQENQTNTSNAASTPKPSVSPKKQHSPNSKPPGLPSGFDSKSSFRIRSPSVSNNSGPPMTKGFTNQPVFPVDKPVSGFIEIPPPPPPVQTCPSPSVSNKLNPKLHVPAPPTNTPIPGSKEALARKRTFAEIVDLSQCLSDDEEAEPPPKVPHLDGVTASGNQPRAASVDSQNPAQAIPGAGRFDHFKLQGGFGKNESLRKRPDMIKPLNKAVALRKSYYDPKTIARDVLIAAGRHPTERPLNQHLQKLKDNFTCVDNSSDLSTFRWDLVDPGGPPLPEVPIVPVICRPPKFALRARAHGSLPNTKPRDLASDHLPPSSPTQQHPPSHLRTVTNVNEQSPTPAQNVPAMPSTPGTDAPRRRGRKPGSKNKSTLSKFAMSQSAQKHVEVAIPVSSPSFHRVFDCKWNGCGAQLHNFYTLRKHVNRVHIEPGQSGLSCLWAGCGVKDKEGHSSNKTFTSDGLRRHAEENHLSAVAWKMGEGPALVRSGESGQSSQSILIS